MAFDHFKAVTCTVRDGLARVTLVQAERGNPLDGDLCHELRIVADALSNDATVRAVLLTAQGRFFSVGGDVKSMAKDRAGVAALVLAWTGELHTALSRLMRLNAPLVAAVQGSVAGGSVSLAAAADIVLCAETAKFTAAFPMLGFSADSGSTVTLTRRMGPARAKRFLMLSETLDAAAAQAAGLVDVVCAPDALAAEAEALAQKLATGPTLAYGAIKELMARAASQSAETQMEDESQMLARMARTEDAWEGLTAFVEKRKPRFQGK